MGRMRSICDAIVTDLESPAAALSLPAHFTHRYGPPPPGAVTPKTTPMLAVYVIRYPRRIIATPGTYEWDADLEIAWMVSGASYSETAGATDVSMPGDLLDTIEAIGDRLETYATAIPGVAGIPPNLTAYGTIGAGETGHNESMVWRAMYELTVTGTALRTIP